MMRHSKAQTMAGPAGQRSALVALPPKTEDVVLLPLSDACERAVYGELERFCRDDFLAMEGARVRRWISIPRSRAALLLAVGCCWLGRC
jgi:hypothetical protein